jgi:DNA modification methylase
LAKPFPEALSGTHEVSFRDLVPEIQSTTYASHGMYYYPAKFIPQVVRYVIQRYTQEGDWIIDPFGGSGTVGIEALLRGRNAALLDLNPMLGSLVEAKTIRNVDWDDLKACADKIIEGAEPFIPSWTRISYWHPPQFFEILSRMWGGYTRSPHPLTLIALLRTTKKFSYADDTVPKLFKSKRKTAKVQSLLGHDCPGLIRRFFLTETAKAYRRSVQFQGQFRGGELQVEGGINLISYLQEGRLRGKFKVMLTSPPYGQAHEYIRSLKLELAWLGFADEEITKLISFEIPYNNPPRIQINSDSYDRYRSLLEGEKVLKYYDTYFNSILFCLGKVGERVMPGGHACIFVGNATFSGVTVPFERIFAEHLTGEGFELEATLVDEIRGRRLFTGRRNPSPEGIRSESLLVLRKK